MKALAAAPARQAHSLTGYAARSPRPTFERGIDLEDEMSGEASSPNRIAAFVDREERYTFVEASLVDDDSTTTLEAWAHDVLLEREPHAERSDGLAMYGRILVYLAMWTDEHGRMTIEYAIVMKGCERLERYVRVTRAEGKRLDIEIRFNQETEPIDAAAHLNAFFDEPLATAAPPERTFAYGHVTNL